MFQKNTKQSITTEVFTNIHLYINSQGEYCVAYKKQNLSIQALAHPVETNMNPERADCFRFDKITDANQCLQAIYLYLHPKAKVTNATKSYKSQKPKNQISNIEYRYFFRPEFNKVWNPANGYTEWLVNVSDLQKEYKDLTGLDLCCYYEQYTKQIQKEEKFIVKKEEKKKKILDKQRMKMIKAHEKEDRKLKYMLYRGAKKLGYVR
jgi:hypothetical protein